MLIVKKVFRLLLFCCFYCISFYMKVECVYLIFFNIPSAYMYRYWTLMVPRLPPPPTCLLLQAQIIAQAIGQAFGVAYQQFLQASGIKASDLKPGEYSSYLDSQELYNGDLAHFSDSQNLRDVSRMLYI